jgi:hypothetical protein
MYDCVACAGASLHLHRDTDWCAIAQQIVQTLRTGAQNNSAARVDRSVKATKRAYSVR